MIFRYYVFYQKGKVENLNWLEALQIVRWLEKKGYICKIIEAPH